MIISTNKMHGQPPFTACACIVALITGSLARQDSSHGAENSVHQLPALLVSTMLSRGTVQWLVPPLIRALRRIEWPGAGAGLQIHDWGVMNGTGHIGQDPGQSCPRGQGSTV